MKVEATLRRARGNLERISTRVMNRLQQERERRFVVAVAFALTDRSRRTAASVLAGALAFRFFLTLLPLTLVAVVGLGYLRDAGGTPSDALAEFGIKGVLASTINQSATLNDPGRVVILLLGLLGVYHGARTSTATLRATHALAWEIPVVRWRRGSSAALVFVASVVVGFACAGLATRARVAAGAALGLGASGLLAVVLGILWVVASSLLPHRPEAGWRDFLPGAFVIGVGFALLQLTTANWIGPKLQHRSALYGSLAVSFVVLGWLYVVGRLLVAAPLLNAALMERRLPKGRAPSASPAVKRMSRAP